MPLLQTSLYVIAVVLALSFVQQLLPESPLGFGVFFLIYAVFAHPFVKWKSWPLVVIGAAVGSATFYLVKRSPVPTSVLVALLILIGISAGVETYNRRRATNRPS